MPIITCIEDLRQLHQKNTPKPFYDYVDAGSYTEGTYRANSADLAALKLRQRVGINVDNRSTESVMIGHKVKLPAALAPLGLTGMQWADGEILAARAAEKFGVPFTLATMSICSIEDVAEATTQPFWFQLYIMRDREFVKRLIARAKAAKCSALVLTLDLQIIGQRHKDLKNGLSVPPKIMLSNLIALAMKPAWACACWVPSARCSATSSGMSRVRRASSRSRNGPPPSSTPRSTGTMSSGSKRNGAASSS